MNIQLERIGRYTFPMGLLDLAIRQDQSQLYAACLDGIYALRLPERDDAEAQPTPECIGRHTSYVSSVALLQDDAELASTGYDGWLQVRSLSPLAVDPVAVDPAHEDQAAGEIAPRRQQPIHSFWSWQMAISPDRRMLASVSGQYLAGAEDYSPQASDEPTVRLVDADSGDELHSFHMLPSVQAVAFDSTGKYLVAGNLMGDLAVWDTASGAALAEWRTPAFTSWGIIKSHCYIGGIFAVAFSPDSESVYAAGMGDMRDPMAGNGKQMWQRFEWRKQPVEKIQESLSDQTGEGLMETLAWHPNGEMFVMAGRLRGGNWNTGIFSRESGQLIGQAKTGMRITSASFSPDGELLYLAGMQGQPGPKDGRFPGFGYVERYRVQVG